MIPSNFNQPRSQHDPEDQPAEAPDDDAGWRRGTGQPGQGPEWAEEHPQEPGLQELRLPSKGIPDLSDIDQ